MNRSGKNYDDMTPEKLQREFREAFFETDLIDDYLNDELEKMQEALDRKKPVEYLFTPEESWVRFLTDHAEELEPFLHPESATEINPQLPENDRFDPEKSWQRFMESRGEELAEFFGSDEAGPEKTQPRTARSHLVSALLRKVLIAAVIVVLLAGAALAAGPLGLWAWVPRWNAAEGRYEPAGQEVSGESPIREALAELGITEPVYPKQLPEGFVITETRISEEPLILFEQYSRGDDRLSVTITPVKGFDSAFYQRAEEAAQTYLSGKAIHYMFRSAGTITAVWCTDHYVVSISGTISLSEINTIIDSVYAAQEKGDQL